MDYTRLAIMESIEALKETENAELIRMMDETKYILECMETGYVSPTMEAVKSDALHGIILRCQAFMSKMAKMFRDRNIKKYEEIFDDETIKKIRNNMDNIKGTCSRISKAEYYPHWDGDWSGDVSVINDAITAAFNNISNGKYDDYTFASKLLKDTSMVKTQDTATGNFLKNYFRFGKTGMTSTSKISYSGSDLFGKVSDVLKYIEAYPKTVVNLPSDIEKKFEARTKSVNVETSDSNGKENIGGVTDSEIKEHEDSKGNKPQPDVSSVQITSNTYLSVLNSYVCETMLPLYMGYSSLLEADNDKDKSGHTKEELDKMSKGEGGESVTKGNVEFKSGDGEGGNAEGDGKEDPAKDECKTYLENITHFFNLALTAYQTSLEERFVAYSQFLSDIAKDYMKKPTSSESDNKTNKGTKANNASTKETKPKKKGFFSRKKK